MTESSIMDLFNIKELKPKQKEAFAIISDKKSVLCFLPTGYGKSYCYQLPAIKEGCQITVVFSPLLALIQDQLKSLKDKTPNVYEYNSTQSYNEKLQILNDIETNPNQSILFTTPESLIQEDSMLSTKILNWYSVGLIERLVFDEAHCLSSWGRGFRPSYQEIGRWYQKYVKDVPITALTATATPQVRQDIIQTLGLSDNVPIVSASIFRDNLSIEIIKRPTKKQMLKEIIELVNKLCTGDSVGIMYSLSRKDCELYAEEINKLGIVCSAYHAGIDKKEKKSIQDKWQKGEIKLVIATIAFGMGIDKANVRLVLHSHMPKDIDGYYQEIGRGGRDNLPTLCRMYYNYSDKVKHHHMLNVDSDYGKHQLSKLYEMYRFCESQQCRHQYIANVYAEKIKSCDSKCDNCLSKDMMTETDIIKYAKDSVDTILWLCEQQNSKLVSKTQINKILASKHRKTTWELHPEHVITKLTIYGYVQEKLITERDSDFYKIMIGVTKQGYDFVNNPKSIWKVKISKRKKVTKTTSDDYSDELYNQLKELRNKKAKELNLRSYNIIPNKTLIDICKLKPKTKDEAISISGFKDKRFSLIGKEILEIISNFK